MPRNCEEDIASFCENSNWRKTSYCDRQFETKWGFPQCAGAVDGTQIPVVAPSDCPTDYYNRKGFHSIIMRKQQLTTSTAFRTFTLAGLDWYMMLVCFRIPYYLKKDKLEIFSHISRGRYMG